MPKLTQRLIDSLRPEDRDRIVFDETVPGFGVRVFRSGRKSYVIQYRSQKRTRRYTLGDCALFTPAEVRKKAARYLADVRCVRQGDQPLDFHVHPSVHQSVFTENRSEFSGFVGVASVRWRDGSEWVKFHVFGLVSKRNSTRFREKTVGYVGNLRCIGYN